MKSFAWTVEADRKASYEIIDAEPLISHDNSLLVKGGNVPGRRLVFVDTGIHAEWRNRCAQYFKAWQVEAAFVPVPGGEGCKDLSTLECILSAMHSFGVERRGEPVIVVGGGAVQDVGGFAASVYRRGVPFIRVPTTLLAYVDASVGIKTGINYLAHKNILGSFYPPERVLLDRSFFSSLPRREIASGLGEVLKLALGCAPDLFRMLEQYTAQNAHCVFRDELGSQILFRSIDVMLEQLSGNIYETDLCRAVDLGHTFSQAFEMHSPQEIRHGEAVALDLHLTAILAHGRGLLRKGDLEALIDLSAKLGLPTEVPDVDGHLIWRSLLERTKHRGGQQRVPMPVGLGNCTFVDDLTEKEVLEAYTELATTHFDRQEIKQVAT